MAKKLKHAGECDGLVRQSNILSDGRMWGECGGGCTNSFGWVNLLPDNTIELLPASPEDMKKIIERADEFFKPVHRHVGDFNWQGKLIVSDQCDCPPCLKARSPKVKRVKLEKGKEIN